MTILTSNMPDLLAPGLQSIFIDALKFGEKPPIVESVFNVKTSTRNYEKDSWVTGFGLVPEKDIANRLSTTIFTKGLIKHTPTKRTQWRTGCQKN